MRAVEGEIDLFFPSIKKELNFKPTQLQNNLFLQNKKQFFPTKIFHFEVVFRETARPLRWCAVFGSIVSLTAKLYFIRLMAPVHELVKETASNFFKFSIFLQFFRKQDRFWLN